MKSLCIALVCALLSSVSFAQNTQNNSVKLTSDDTIKNSEIRDILNFEGIEFKKLKFAGKELADKTYKLTVKEIWDGKIKTESTIIDSNVMPYDELKKINDTVFNLKIISKLTPDNKLKMNFCFPRFSTEKQFDAIKSDDYSLRNIASNAGTKIIYGKKFYLLAYILPYEKDGSKYWCAVESSGKNIENWGKEFGIKHYLVFEMVFE
ncbi:MAG: hypothetical protein AAF611_04410 [Bacteroidota bacterium]